MDVVLDSNTIVLENGNDSKLVAVRCAVGVVCMVES